MLEALAVGLIWIAALALSAAIRRECRAVLRDGGFTIIKPRDTYNAPHDNPPHHG